MLESQNCHIAKDSGPETLTLHTVHGNLSKNLSEYTAYLLLFHETIDDHSDQVPHCIRLS